MQVVFGDAESNHQTGMEVEPIALLRQRDEISELSILVETYFEGFNFGRLKCPFSFAFCSKGPERLHEASR